MKLGAMLIRDGRITEAQLVQAMAQQARDGGKLGTVLVEMGFCDLDTITVYLGIELGIPIATGATLERAKRSAVRLLRPEQAARYRCIPIVIQERQLMCAIEDPLDLQVLDELQRVTGYRIVPRVATEIRIYYYLERYYGIPRPQRFRPLGDLPRGSRKPGGEAGLPAPLPGLPPRTATPVAAPTPVPVLRTVALREPASPPAPVSAEQRALERDAANLVVELDADSGPAAPEMPTASAEERIATRPITGAPPVRYTPLSLAAALAAMEQARERGEIADAMMGHLVSLFDVSLLLLVRDNMAFGWKAAGDMVDLRRVESMLIPLEAPSVFQVALHSDERLFRGRPFNCLVNSHLNKVLHCAPPEYAAVMAVVIGRRVVNLAYGHRGSELPEPEFEGLRRLGEAASAAYVRLIAVAKQSDEPAGGPTGTDAAGEAAPATDPAALPPPPEPPTGQAPAAG